MEMSTSLSFSVYLPFSTHTQIEFVPEIQQLSSDDQNQSKFKNLASNTSQLIIDRLLANSLGSTSFKWYYTEKDLNLWRQTPRE